MSSNLNQEDFATLVKTLRENTDIFAWSMVDMPRVSPNILTHKLSVSLTNHLVKYKKQNFAHDQS